MQATLFALLLAAANADTASGGLAETSASNTAYTKRFILDSDPNYDEDRLANLRGSVVVSITERDEPALGASDEATAIDVVVRMLVLTKRDTNRTNQNAINARIRDVFDKLTLSGDPWRFSELSRTGGRQLRAGKKLQRYVHEFVCTAVYDASVSSAPILGRTVTLSFASNLGVTSRMLAKQVSVQMSSPSRAVTRWEDTGARQTRQQQQVRMTCAFTVRASWPDLVAIQQRSAVVTVNVGGTSFALTEMLIEDVRVRAVSNAAARVELDLVGTAVGVAGELIVS